MPTLAIFGGPLDGRFADRVPGGYRTERLWVLASPEPTPVSVCVPEDDPPIVPSQNLAVLLFALSACNYGPASLDYDWPQVPGL